MEKKKRRTSTGIRPLGNGEFRARKGVGPRGQQKQLYFRGTMNECRAWWAEMTRRIEGGLPLFAPIDGLSWPTKHADAESEGDRHIHSGTTLYQLAEDYRKHPDLYVSRARSTKTEIDYAFRVFLDWCDRNGIRSIDEMQARGEDFYAWMVGAFGEKEYAIVNVMKRVKKLFKFALAKRRRDPSYCSLQFNPLEDCNPPQPTRGEVRFLTKESEHPKLREFMRVPEMEPYGTEEYWRGVWELLYYTGMRPGELCHLRWRKVHLADGYILIDRTAKSEAERLGEEAFSPKVRKRSSSFNRIELHPKAVQWLEYFKALQSRGRFCVGVKAGTFAAPPLEEEVVDAILAYIAEVDRAVPASELYDALVAREVIEPYTQAAPARYLAIRLARTDVGGELARRGLERKYGFPRHFPEGDAEIMHPSGEKQVTVPIFREPGPYVIGGAKPMREHTVYDYYCRLIERTMAAYPELDLSDTSPKVFRASIGSHMLQLREDLVRVSRFLRHSSVKVTEAHYASLLRSDIRAAVSIVP